MSVINLHKWLRSRTVIVHAKTAASPVNVDCVMTSEPPRDVDASFVTDDNHQAVVSLCATSSLQYDVVQQVTHP